jgi:hypothetical protein
VIRAAAIALAALLAGCGAADEPPAASNTSNTCFRCYFANGGLVQQSYACSAADAQQFGRRCL